MEMMNRAIEDASAFMEFRRELEKAPPTKPRRQRNLSEEDFAPLTKPLEAVAPVALTLSDRASSKQRRPGENREQHRKRVRLMAEHF